MALTTTKVGGASATTTSLGSGTLSPTVAAGDWLVAYISQGTGGALLTGVTDNSGSGSWTLLGTGANSASMEGAWYYKEANGSETTVTASFSSSAAADMVVTKTTGWTGTPTLQDSDENVSHITTAILTSPIAMGTVTSTTASAVVITWVVSDALGTITTGQSVSDGAAYSAVGDQGTQIYVFAHEKSSTGTFSPSFSYSDTGDQVYAATMVVADVTSSGTTVSVPAGSLTLTGFAPTVVTTANRIIAVPVGTLTLTGFAPTVTASDHKTVAVPAGSLTLTGFAPTVSVAPAGSDTTISVPAGSLTLTGFAPTVSVSDNKLVAVPLGQITLTRYAPTVTATQNVTVSIPKGQLTLTGFAPTVLGSTVASKGSISWNESDYKLNQRLRKLAIQQSYIEDDEEALAILLASIIRRD